MMTIMLILHAIGAHYTYSEMPFGNWLRDYLHLTRNPYDRIVHFVFGLLIAYPLYEFLLRKYELQKSWSYLLSIHIIMAWSNLFEILEAIVAHVMSPELGAAYNGIQGDIWDAQKDSALAMMGAILTISVTIALERRELLAQFLISFKQRLFRSFGWIARSSFLNEISHIWRSNRTVNH
jgi:putative membrane protein